MCVNTRSEVLKVVPLRPVKKLTITVLVDNWVASIKSPESYLLGDINTDGAIDLSDLEIFLDHRNHQADWRTQQNSKSE